jgi:hypothetical protein
VLPSRAMSHDALELQFERAEHSDQTRSQTVSCAACGTPLSSYFEVNGKLACEPCKDAAQASQSASHLPGLLRGAALGAIAAAVGAGIYYAIAQLTGYEFGLMSIVLGLMVGFAVRRGARGRGGWRYQALAMFLCYAAICATYVPRVLEAMRKSGEKSGQAAASQTAAARSPASAAGESGAAKGGTPATGQAAARTETTPAPAASAEKVTPVEPPSLSGFLGAVGMLLALTLALPFLAGFENLMGLVIIGIGLYEAWKVNRAAPFSVSGPFAVGAARGG